MRELGSDSTSSADEAVVLVTRAWLRHGPKGMFGRVVPGLLIASDRGIVSFATHSGTVFAAERNAIRNWLALVGVRGWDTRGGSGKDLQTLTDPAAEWA